MQKMNVNSLAELNEAIADHPLVLVDFYKDDCQGCAVVAQSLNVLEKRFDVEDVVLVKAKLEDLGEDAFTGLNLRSLPTLKIFKNGVQVRSMTGASAPAMINSVLVKARK